MSAPLFLVEPGSLPESGPVLLGGAEGRHAAKVRRVRVGERIDLADGAGVVAECTVTTVAGEALEMAILTRRMVPEPAPRLAVAQALPKGDRGELAVELMTELGVDVVIPWAAARCVTRWSGPRGERSAARWAAHAREAAKQARRPRVPAVRPLADTAALAARVGTAALAIVLHEEATEPLAALQVPAAGEVLLFVGPEGGIDAAEIEALTAAGARPCRLGPEILRTSTAGAAALAVLAARSARWS